LRAETCKAEPFIFRSRKKAQLPVIYKLFDFDIFLIRYCFRLMEVEGGCFYLSRDILDIWDIWDRKAGDRDAIGEREVERRPPF